MTTTALSTLSVDGLQHLLGGLGLDDPIPSFPEADISSRAKDIYHSYLADVLLKLVDCDSHVAYEAIQSSTEISNGDLVIVMPKLRLPGVKAADMSSLGLDLTRKVCLS
jgi:arginyl-tRNA synthetase